MGMFDGVSQARLLSAQQQRGFANNAHAQYQADLMRAVAAAQSRPAVGANHKPLPDEYVRIGPVAPVGSIVGHRLWRPLPQNKLRAVGFDHPWPVLAPCVGDPSQWSPTGKGGGIYARKKRMMHDAFEVLISGTVYLWGDIVEHEHGYRAEYGYPCELLAVTEDELERITPYAQVYGVTARMLT